MKSNRERNKLRHISVWGMKNHISAAVRGGGAGLITVFVKEHYLNMYFYVAQKVYSLLHDN